MAIYPSILAWRIHTKMGRIKGRAARTQQKQKRLRRGGKNTHKNCTKKVLMTPITRTGHPGVLSQVGFQKHDYEQS